MWNEESSLAVNHWRDFLNEEKPPELETAVEIEEPIEPGAPPATSPPQEPTPEELHADLEKASVKYPICKTNPELCRKVKKLDPDVYEDQILLKLEDIPSRLDINKDEIEYDNEGMPTDMITKEVLTDNFVNFLNRQGGWQRFAGSDRIIAATPQHAWGTTRTVLLLQSLAFKVPDTDKSPIVVRNLSRGTVTGDAYDIGGGFPPHVSHKDGRDVDISVALLTSKYSGGQSVDQKGRFLGHGNRMLNYFDPVRNAALVRVLAPHSKNIFLWSGHKRKLMNHFDELIKQNEMTKEEKRDISIKISDGCSKRSGKRTCRDHDNHFHIRFHGESLPRYVNRFAPWYKRTGTGYQNLSDTQKARMMKLYKAAGAIKSDIKPGGKDAKLWKVINDMERTDGRALTRQEKQDLYDLWKEHKFKEIVNLLKEWKSKKYLFEQPMDPAMMDPAAQRMQMQKQVIQMQFGPIITQAADIMFTLNSLEDPAAKQQARIYADRIQGSLRDFLSGKQEPMESIEKLGPIVDEMGRKLQRFMS